MNIQCTDKKTIELTDSSEKLGHIAYDGLFSFKANAIVGNDNYKITPIGIFCTAISVTKNGAEVASMQMNWKGHIIISFQNGQEYILKATGTFLNKYVLEDKDQQKLMLLNPDVNWGKLGYNYSISYDNKPQDILLVLLATYSANYCIAAMSSLL
ncbi:MAG TPA: hypothetical protein VK616_17005 [Flavitalea sp.]|nr:hypothetical protein [Flavitalea sp.]HTF28987.1 hypothetical protein [Flavitalea sp.]